MPRDLSPQELDFYNQRSRTENILEQPEPVMGRSNLFGSAVDSLQGQLYGLAEAAGLRSARDLRLANEAEANRVSSAYYRQTGSPRTMGDISSAGDLGSYVLDKAVESAPTMGAIVGASLVNPAAAFGMSSLLGTADVVDNQRQAGGRTNLAAAVPLGLAYGASDMLLGSTAALARRGLGTGVKAIDDLGTSALANLPGKTGAATRFGVNLLKTGAAEAVDETFQELMNRTGRTAVSNEKIFDDEALDSYGESAFAGGLLGGVFGLPGAVGAARGRKAPTIDSGAIAPVKSVDNPAQPTNLLDTQQTRPGGLLPPGPMAQGSLFNSGDEGTVSWLPEGGAQLPPLNSLLEQRQNLRGQLDTLQGMYDEAEQEFKATGDADVWGQKRNRLMGMLGQLSPLADELEAQIEQATRNEAGNYGRQGALDFSPEEQEAQRLGLGYQGPLAGTPIVFPDGSVALSGEQELDRRYGLSNPWPEQPAAPGRPIQVDMFGNAAATREDVANQNDPGAVIARQQWAKQQESVRQAKAVEEQIKADEAAAAAAAAQYNVKGGAGVKLFVQLRQMLADGDIQQDQFNTLVGTLAARKQGEVKREINSIYAKAQQEQLIEQSKAAELQASIDKVQQKASNGTPTTQAQQAAPQGSQAPAAAAPAAAVSTQAPVVSGGSPVVTGTLAERTKAEWDKLASKTPGMPAYETLSKGQVSRAEDLVNRDVFNLRAAVNVVSTQGGKLAYSQGDNNVQANQGASAASLGRSGRGPTAVEGHAVVPQQAGQGDGRHSEGNPDRRAVGGSQTTSGGIRQGFGKTGSSAGQSVDASGSQVTARDQGSAWETNARPQPDTVGEASGATKKLLSSGLEQVRGAVGNPKGVTAGAVAGIDGNKTVSVGRKGREKSVTASELVTKMEKATPLEKARIAAAVGFEATVDPTTGAPKLVQIGEPQTLEAIAAAESKVTGKKVTKEAIRLSLLKFGITPDVIDRVQAIAPDTVSTEELGINPDENGSGFRVETQVSKATGQGLVDDGVGETKKQREARAQADEILKAAGPSTELAMADDRPTNLPDGVVVTDLRDGNQAKIDANIKALLNDPEASNAASDWDSEVVSWNDLPDSFKADWISAYIENLADNGGDLNFQRLERNQGEIEDGYATFKSNSRKQATAGAGGPRIHAAGESVQGKQGGSAGGKPGQNLAAVDSRDAEKVTDAEVKPVTPFAPRAVASDNDQHTTRSEQAAANTGAKDGVSGTDRAETQGAQSKPARDDAGADAQVDRRGDGQDAQKAAVAPFSKPQFSKASKASKGSDAKTLAAELRAFMRVGTLGDRVVVVQSIKDIPAGVQRSVGASNNTQGFVFGGKAYLIADQIAAGNGRAVFMHEVGAHLGMEEILGAHYDTLVGKVKEWALRRDNSQEFKLADKAMQRALDAAGNGELNDTELVAYFIEEAINAGIEPSALKHGPLRQFMQQIFDLFKKAIARFYGNPDKVTAQDFVDLAYGAARIEMKEPINPGGGDGAPKFSIAKKAEDQARKVAGETGAKIAVDTTNLASKALGALTYLHDIVESAKAKLPSAEKWYKATMDIQAARNRMNQEAERIVKMFTETGIRAAKVNKMLFDATFEQKWPYDTQHLDRKTGQMVTIKADPELANRFDNELTAKERAIVEAVFAHGEKMLDHKYAVLKKLGLEGTFKAETGKLQGPYAPLKRFGNYISVLKSADLVAAEDAGDEKLVEKLKADPQHYEVRFHDTKGQASEYARANAKAGGQAYHFEKSERVGGALPMNSRVLSNIRAALKMDDKMPPQARAHFEQMLQELEFQALDEHHARTSGLTRKNRAGAEEDMMRSFLANARAQANFLAQLEYGKEANTQFYAMQREASKDGYAGQDEFNLLAKHYAASFDTQDTPIQNRITAMTTAFQLATSLGYHITNALQGVMVTVPKLAADFNDYTGAMDQLHNGYKTWLAAGGLKGKFDLDSVKDAGLRAALQHAADMGVLDVGMTEDLSQFEAFRTGYKGIDAASGKMSKLMHKLNQVSRYVETANRVSAATAAYKMAMAKHGDQAKAQEYAARILQTTQGDFSATGSPLIFKKLPKFVMQYKKYQFMMASLYANAFNAALRGATPEERAVGRRFLTYKLATTGVAAGFLGLPLMNVAALAFGMTGDDDEPKDLERSLRDWIGDDGLADLILRGPLNAIGLDMSAKLGDDKIFSIAPYTDIDFSSGGSAAKTLLGIGGGPAATQIMRMATGVEYLSKGDMQKGFENLVPSGLANASKALRIANEGYTLKIGTVMYSPDEISGLTLMFDAIGLKSSQMKHMEFVRNQQYEIGKFVSDRTKELKADYVQAYRDGNTDELGKLSEHWLRLQEVKRDLRPMFNNSVDELKTQPLSDLLRSPANALKRDLKAQKASW